MDHSALTAPHFLWQSVALVAILSQVLCGCTLLGAGVGAGIDSLVPGPYESRAPIRSVQLTKNERVRLILANGARVEGRFLGALPATSRDPQSYLLIDGQDGIARVASRNIKTLGIEVTGNGWLYGGLIGLAVDVTLVVATIVALQNMEYNLEGWSEGNCFC